MKMKKIALAALAALTLIMPGRASAAEVDNTEPMWGLRLGYDMVIPGNWHVNGESVKMFRLGQGFTAGAVCNIYLGRQFFFEPGVSLFYDTYSYDDLRITNSNGEIVSSDPTVYKFGLRVPLNVGYGFNVTPQFPLTVYTGPELSYALAGDIRFKHPELLTDEPGGLHLYGPNGFQRRFDLAWKIGVGFPVGSFLISLDGAIGLLNLNKPAITYREHRVAVGITYYL